EGGAVAQADRDATGPRIRDGDIREPIAVEVGGGAGDGLGPAGRRGRRRIEVGVSIAGYQRDDVVALADDREIDRSVGREATGDGSDRPPASRPEYVRRREGAVAEVQDAVEP